NTEGRLLYYDCLNIEEATNISNYIISSSDDPNYSTAKHPVIIGRKSKGRHFHRVDENPQFLSWHFIYIELPIELQSGKSYRLLLNNLAGNTNKFNFIFEEKKTRSEAIHVTQAGFKPNDKKYAYISQFMGDFNSEVHRNGGLNLDSYASKSFHLINLDSESVVYTGSISLQKSKIEAETDSDMYGPYNNYTNADVWQCDFSTFTTPGRYRLCVDNMGCSYPFSIDDQAYRDAYYYAMKALFYQRSGIYKYVEEYDTVYPAGFLDNKMFYDPSLDPREHVSTDNFDKTKQVSGIWGWYHDAGDWDSYNWRTAKTTAMLLMAYELFPDNFYDGAVANKWKRNKDDPWYDEGTNGIPDILDEAGWFIKFMRRAKDSLLASGYGSGGCPAYIGREAGSHKGIPSWEDERDLAITKEDPGITILYAGLAAWYAKSLEQAGVAMEEVNDWIADAEEAYQWAIKNGVEAMLDNKSLKEEPLFGLGCLFRATGKAEYQTEFMNHFAIRYSDYWKSPDLDQIVSILYGLLPPDHPNLNLDFQQSVSAKIKQDAYNAWQKNHDNKGFRASHIVNSQIPLHGALNIPKTLYQAFVYKLEGSQEYYDAVKCIADYTLGGNQMNMVSMTGYGWNYDEMIFHPDSWYLLDYNSMVYNDPILNGYTSNGAYRTPDFFGWGFKNSNDEDFSRSSAYPVIWQKDGDPGNNSIFPVSEARFFNRNSIAGSEFVIHQNCHNLAFTYGILAGNPVEYTPNRRPELSLNLNDNNSIKLDSAVILSVSGTEDLCRVEYYYDWHYIGASEDKSADFSFNWNPGDFEIDSGEHLITARGFDEKGLSTLPTDEGDKSVVFVNPPNPPITNLAVNNINSRVYPIPVKDYCLVSSAKLINSISVISFSGEVLKKDGSFDANEYSLNLSWLTNGLYLLKIHHSDKTTEVIKIIKNK
ncbi:MAG: glycoside hydrolase family 9 protein, partial [Bacteroidales bacterium]